MSSDNIGTLVGKIYDLVKDLSPDDISRVFGAVSALVGGNVQSTLSGNNSAARNSNTSPTDASATHQISTDRTDIKTFIQTKNPKNDSQLAATIAYYYCFEAPTDQKKDAINSTDLTEAIRLANKKRPTRPSQVLINAKNMGLLDNAGDRGHFKINSVGENLVAMVLPGDGTKSTPTRRKKAKNSGGNTKNRQRN